MQHVSRYNIVLLSEAFVRLHHELSRHDIIYIDATGVMSDFALAILIACLKEFNNESLTE